MTAVVDSQGHFELFNLAPGDWTVQAYASGINCTPASVTGLLAGEDRAVDLAVRDHATATVIGTLQPTGQNQPPALLTSVILVVRSTYLATIDRGEAPPGLVAAPLTTSSSSISGVPDGAYTVPAAFGNDGYVRDISGIGGTQPLDVQVAGGVMTSAAGAFKITGAVSLATGGGITPTSGSAGASALVPSATPTFAWLAYPSAHQYQVVVFDALGAPLWTPAAVGRAPRRSPTLARR